MPPARRHIASLLRAKDADTETHVIEDNAWDAITNYACTHGLAGLVLEAVSDREIQIDQAHRTLLAQSAARIAARNLHLQHHFGQLATCFAQAGVEIMVLKGMALNHLLYDRLDLRPMTDVDLLLRPEDVTKAMRVLEQAGCIAGEPLVRDDFFPRFYYEREFRPADAPDVKFDVHARLFRPWRYRTVPADALWADARRLTMGDATITIPSHEGMLLHLCVHAACHGTTRMLWLLDIHRYILRFRHCIRWSTFIHLAREWQVTWPSLVALREVDHLFGPTTPDWVSRQLQAVQANWADRLALWQAPRDDRHPVARLMVDAVTGGAWREQLGYISAILLPQRTHMADIYKIRHPGWIACAHIWRMLRIPTRSVTRLVEGLRTGLHPVSPRIK
ncbi:MAG: nucleotidyltransferase family protein [Planctomycetes bacterium]|nr:nucleotidyltransferase family protein [Planctomycetota bacterium]